MKDNSQLEVIVKNSGLEKSEGNSLMEKFSNYEDIAKEWEGKAKSIVVTDSSQTTEMAMAREARLKFSKLRIDVEKSRKAMKEQSLRKGQAIDAIARFLVSLISPIEEHLKLQEDFTKIEEAKKQEQLRIEAENKAEKERLELEEKERKEQERIRLENIKLKNEADAREKKMAEEREKAELEKAESDRKQRELEEKLKNMIKCPECGYKFNIEK